MDSDSESEVENQSVPRYKSYCLVLGAVLCFNLSSFYFGYSLTYFNAVPYDFIHQSFAIPFDKGVGEGLYSGCVPFGAIFGSLSSRLVLSYFSRKYHHS